MYVSSPGLYSVDGSCRLAVCGTLELAIYKAKYISPIKSSFCASLFSKRLHPPIIQAVNLSSCSDPSVCLLYTIGQHLSPSRIGFGSRQNHGGWDGDTVSYLV